MSKKQTPAPIIESRKFSSLIIDPVYSGRSEREINEAAKEKAKELAAAGGWDQTQPGIYFTGEDGKDYLLAGFCRVAASRLNGEDSGYFTKREGGDEIDRLLAFETTNSSVPISLLSRGAHYAALRDGVIADDFAGTIADPGEPSHWKRQPITVAKLAERVGKSHTIISRYIAIHEAPDGVRELLEEDKISSTVSEGARKLANKHHNGSEAVILKICKRALAQAKSEDKESATQKHFDAIKSEFIPLKAAPVEQETTKESSKSKKKDDTAESASGDSGEPEPNLFSGRIDNAPIPTPGTTGPAIATATEAAEITKDEERRFAGEVPKKFAKEFVHWKAVVARWMELTDNDTVTEEDQNRLASAIVLSPVVPF